MSIIFMGTSDFSKKILTAMLEAEFEIAAVYTRAPKPTGRGYKVMKSPVHEFAEERSIMVCTPTTLRSSEQEAVFRSLMPYVAVVAAYGLIIPQNILDIPTHGFINVHASLLPRWRGAAPIQAAILAGDQQSGVSIMKMDAGVDTGDIISMKSIDISTQTTHGELSKQMAILGAKMIVETLSNLSKSLAEAYSQPTEGVTYAGKIGKESNRIDWTQSAEQILRIICAFSPYPSAWSEMEGMRIKIISANIETNHNKFPYHGDNCCATGDCSGLLHGDMTVSCGDSRRIKLTLLQPAGKKFMNADDFARGYGKLVGKQFH
ncbi:MAG: methionyl-tRNA formyltransferase [Holosporaceae bacterium]|jgi:methionyl-tRNA formyltransferase|nr:methionyl-tRNA formyltransferase [Holosporaceae bacterium]